MRRILTSLLALLTAVAAGYAVSRAGVNPVTHKLPTELPITVLILVFAGAVSVGVLWFSYLAYNVLFVLLTRGPRYIRVVSVERCNSHASWVASEWCVPSQGGLHTGLRLCGVEMAFTGKLR